MQQGGAYGQRGFGGGVTCPVCGASCEAGDAFCITCGTPLGGAAAPAPAAGQGAFSGDHTVLVSGPNMAPTPSTCPVCGQPVMPNTEFCTSCGTRLTAPAAQASPVTPTQPTPNMPAAGTPGAGAASSGDHTVLVSGGGIPQPQATACPACGAPVNPGDAFCTSCGAPLGAAPAPGYGQQGQVTMPTDNQPTTTPTFGGAQVYSAGAPAAARGPQDGVSSLIKEEAPITSRPQLMLLTREEARNGCTKTIEVDGQIYSVDVPAGITEDTVLDLPGIGYFDTDTGVRGSVRLTFFID